MELEIEKTEIVSANNIQVEVPNAVEISEGKKDYEVSVVKKEYTIIGDSIFIPSMYEDAPPWLKEFIDTTIDIAVNTRDQSLIDRMHSILTAIDYVPKNQYTEQINQIVGEDGIINSRIATLNSNLTDAINSTNATVAEINLTYASKDEAAAIANNVITASLSGSGEIGSALIQLQEAYATLENTTAQSISTLESVMEGEITGNATAIETIRTYVGIDESGASTGTGLSAYLEASDGTIGGADSQLANDVRVTAEGVESKFAYNSILNINGTSYSSGFGIATSLTSGSGLPTGQSEFWIKADKFKLMSANGSKKSSYSPFTVDSVTGEINFNGKVTFSNVTNVPQLGSTPQEVVNAVNSGQTTTIDGGKITTGSITANQINTTGLIAENISASEIVGKTITGSVINGAKINGAVIKASYLDLDGDLEILTNYHITVAMYNANPSLYTDAVYISADNEYRIPSISIIKETDSVSSGNGCSIYGIIRSYNTANAGHNTKAVKIRPYFIISENITLFKTYYTAEDTRKTQRGILYLGNILLIDASMSNDILTINGINYDMPDIDQNSSVRSANITLTRYGLSITVSAVHIGSGDALYIYSNSGLSIVLNATTGVYLGANFEDTTRGFYIKDLSSAYSNEYSKSSCSISSKIAINNMI